MMFANEIGLPTPRCNEKKMKNDKKHNEITMLMCNNVALFLFLRLQPLIAKCVQPLMGVQAAAN